MTQPTDLEQLLLEYVNDARLDPLGNAARYITSYAPLQSGDSRIQSALGYFQVSGTALESAFAALKPVAPLAWNDSLGTAAQDHSAAMIAARDQAHQVAGEPPLLTRLTDAGYVDFFNAAENIFAYSESVLYAHAGFMVDWGGGEPDGMQSPAGHRIAIMNAGYREIGIDVTAENSSANPLGPQVVTQDFGNRNKLFVLGVAYSDTDGDDFYSVGEGRADLSIENAGTTITSSSSGGYSLGVEAGAQTLVLTGGGLAGAVTVETSIAGNLKLDVVDGDTLLTSGSITASGPIEALRALGVTGLSLTTGAGDQVLAGTSAADVLNGGEGTDVAEFTGHHSEYTFSGTAADLTVQTGPDGADRLQDIEILRFSDGDFAWSTAGGLMSYVPGGSDDGNGNGDGGGTGPDPDTGGRARLYLVPGSQDYGPVPGGALSEAIGSNLAEKVTLAADANVALDPSFVRGNDTIVILGEAGNYHAAATLAGVTIASDDGATIRIPAFGEGGGLRIEFADASLDLLTHDGGATFTLAGDSGDQNIGGLRTPIAPDFVAVDFGFADFAAGDSAFADGAHAETHDPIFDIGAASAYGLPLGPVGGDLLTFA